MEHLKYFNAADENSVVYEVNDSWRLEFQPEYRIAGDVVDRSVVWVEKTNSFGGNQWTSNFPLVITFSDTPYHVKRVVGYFNFPLDHDLYRCFQSILGGSPPEPFFDLLRDHLPESHEILDQIFGG